MLEHLAANWGSYASVVGLVFSILAFVFSKRASQAAREARDSILRRSLSEDMNEASRIAAEIVRFVSLERRDMAQLRTDDLLARTGYYISRWGDHLSNPSRSNLRRAQNNLISVSETLTRKVITEMTPNEKSSLATACQTVHSIFSEEHGASIKSMDRIE